MSSKNSPVPGSTLLERPLSVGRAWLHQTAGFAGVESFAPDAERHPVYEACFLMRELPVDSTGSPVAAKELMEAALEARGLYPVCRAEAAEIFRISGYALEREHHTGHALSSLDADAKRWFESPTTPGVQHLFVVARRRYLIAA